MKRKDNTKNNSGWLPIHYVTYYERIVDLISYARSGENLNQKIFSSDKYDGHTPLTLAIIDGKVNMVRTLARLGADLDLKANTIHPFTYALKNQEKAIEIVEILISYGTAGIKDFQAAVNQLGEKVLLNLGVNPKFVSKLIFMLKNTDKVINEYIDKYDTSFLNNSPEENQIAEKILEMSFEFGIRNTNEFIKLIHDPSIPEDAKYRYNYFTLASLATPPDYKTMIKLAKSGYDINREDQKKLSSYEYMMLNHSIFGLCILGSYIDLKDRINKISDKTGFNDLHYAIMDGDIEKVAFLLSFGGDPNLPDAKGYYPLSIAMLYGKNIKDILYLLVKNGANYKDYDIEYIDKHLVFYKISPTARNSLLLAQKDKLKNPDMEYLMNLYSRKLWDKLLKTSDKKISILIEALNSGTPMKLIKTKEKDFSVGINKEYYETKLAGESEDLPSHDMQSDC